MRPLADRVEAARRSWNLGDLAGYLSLYDSSVKLHGYTPEPMDKAAVTEFYETVCAALSDPGARNPHLEFHEVLVDGDLYTCRFTMSGTHTGTFMGVPATNRPYSISGITILRFAPSSDRVVERFSQADMLGLMVQIGAVPAPAG
jgi:predicted ester cyclase